MTVPTIEADIAVLGAGIVGVSIAVHLQKSGLQTVLIDRRGAGEETSFGNAGLIQREGVFPHAFPRQVGELLRYARNTSTDASYHYSMMPKLLGPFARYWYNSQPDRYMRIARSYAPLMAASIDEHVAMAEQAGATDLLRPGGWIVAHSDPRKLAASREEADTLKREFGINSTILDSAGLAETEPHLRAGLAGGIHWTDPLRVFDPYALTMAYVGLFQKLGGKSLTGDANTVTRNGTVWQVTTAAGRVSAKQIVVALGPWAAELVGTLGYRPPVFVKRGYHMHYGLSGNAVLNHAVLDMAHGYMLAPMRAGVRMTTGAEFADRDAPPTPVQLGRAETALKTFLPAIAERRDPTPWKGARPCTPDMLPIIGRAPGHDDAWFAFGHAHHGLTLGPATGRLLAEMVTRQTPFTDPAPYRPDRF